MLVAVYKLYQYEMGGGGGGGEWGEGGGGKPITDIFLQGNITLSTPSTLSTLREAIKTKKVYFLWTLSVHALSPPMNLQTPVV